ncbi:hypothetical protein [Rhodococcus qingshengii]|nr:hypothetical protein [Rhodococcus qingshengii]
MWGDVRAPRIFEGSSPIHERNLARAMIKKVGAERTFPDLYRV